MQVKLTDDSRFVRNIQRHNKSSLRTSLHKGLRAFTAVCMAMTFSIGAVAQPTAAYAAGGTYYVSTTGSDTTGNGSSSSPWATIQKATSTISGGDTVYVASGTYSPFTIAKAGTSGAYTQLIADGPVTISGGTQGITVAANYVRVRGFRITGYSGHGIYNSGYSYTSVENCQIDTDTGTNPNQMAGIYLTLGTGHLVNGCSIHDLNAGGIHIIDCSTVTVSNNQVNNLAEDGIVVQGVGIVVDGNTLHDLQNQTNHSDGIVVQAPWSQNAPTSGTVIRNNTIYDVIQHIYIDSFKYPSTPADSRLITNTSIYNNLLYVTDASYYQTGICFDAENRNITAVTAYNNTLVNFVNAGANAMRWVTRPGTYSGFDVKNNVFNNSLFDQEVPVSALVLDNNLYYRPGGGYIIRWLGTWYSSLAAFKTTVGREAHGVSGNPALTSAYVPGPSSAAVGVGVGPSADVRVPTIDKAGVARQGMTASIGAYEYVNDVAPPADTIAPTVSITSPTSGATVSGSVALAATAADNVGVARVEFRADGVLVGTDTSAPYAAAWDASSASAGSHTIQARAIDAAGNATNAAAAVNVAAPADTTAPTVSLTSPTTGATVAGSVALAATAADNVGVARVEFRANGVLVGTDTSAPYAAAWDASSASAGSHTIQARAIDAAGNATNAAAAVNVAAPADTTAPTAPTFAASSGDNVVNLTWTSAADAWTTRVVRSTIGYASSWNDASQQLVYEGVGSIFSDTSVANGTAYYYTAFSSDAAGNWSAGSRVVAAPMIRPSLSLYASASTVAINKYVTLTGKYYERGIAVQAPSAVTVWSDASGTWKQVGYAAYSSRRGSYSYKVRITKTASYQFRNVGDSVRMAASSSAVQITAKSTVTLQSSTSVLAYGSRAKVTGAVNSASPRKVKIYRYAYSPSSKRWIYKGAVTPRVTARTSTYATFSAYVPVMRRGSWKLVAKHSVSGKTIVSRAIYRRVR